MAKIDLGKMINDAWQLGTFYANKMIGSAGSPLNKPVATAGQLKVGNVGGIFGINLNVTTLALIGVGIIGVIFVAKKLK